MLVRGRSREISRAALARQASEERVSLAHEASAQCSRRNPGHASTPQKPNIPQQLFVTAPGPLMPGSTTVTIQNSEVRRPLVADDVAPTAPTCPTPIEPVPFASHLPFHAQSPPTSAPEPISSHCSSNETYLCDYYDSPPSPPHTIEDQLHVAFAHDDIHLAKILLLKVKGIEVTSDDDPRITAVRDEDFDEYFLPNGMLLLTEEEEQRVKKAQQAEAERIKIRLERSALRERERKRELWEKQCEKIWENEKLRLREEKARIKMVRQKREDQRRAQQQEFMSCQSVTTPCRARKAKLSHSSLSGSRALSASSTSAAVPSRYAYTFVVAPSQQIPRLQDNKACREYATYASDYSIDTAGVNSGTDWCEPSVTFKEVIASMNGSLFPLSEAERVRLWSRLPEPVSTSKHHHEVHLLDVLLDSEATSWTTGRLIEAPSIEGRGWRREGACTKARMNSSSILTSSPLTVTSESQNLSSFSLLTSDMTTPAAPSSFSSVKPFGDAMEPFTQISGPNSSSCQCFRPVSRSIMIHPSQGPLFVPPLVVGAVPSSSPKPLSSQLLVKSHGASPSFFSSTIIGRSSSKLRRHMDRFIQVAKEFHSAYLYSMVSPNRGNCRRDEQMRLMPDGYRASKEQVNVFLGILDSLTSFSTPPTYIPLGNGEDVPQCVVLKHLLSYQTPSKLLNRGLEPLISPFLRAYQQGHVVKSRLRRNMPMLDPRDDSEFRQVISRSRSVSPDPEPRKRFIRNPVFMRMKAMQGAVYEQGRVWDPPKAKAGRLSCGKERILVCTTALVGDSPLGRGHR